jgi:FkbM family methyltransferase
VYTTFSNNTNRDTLERTGPGPWTDFVLKHAAQANPEWPIRILPRVAFGVNPKCKADAVAPDNPNIAVMHHFMGSWKVKGGWKRAHSFTETLVSFATRSLVASEEEEMKETTTVFPVSALWEPPFTIFVNLVGAGHVSGGEDISSELTIWGTWQPGTSPTRKPSVVEALAGALSSQRAQGGAFLDIGAGLGYFSLAAAARGHHVVAVELAHDSVELFQQSIKFNKYEDRITLHQKALGAHEEEICLSRTDLGEAVQANQIASGYASADSHRIEDGTCRRSYMRVPLDKLLSAQEAQSIGVVRIDANGWEG